MQLQVRQRSKFTSQYGVLPFIWCNIDHIYQLSFITINFDLPFLRVLSEIVGSLELGFVQTPIFVGTVLESKRPLKNIYARCFKKVHSKTCNVSSCIDLLKKWICQRLKRKTVMDLILHGYHRYCLYNSL